MINASKKFNISVLGKHAALEQIAHFGFNSGRDKNKFEGICYETDSLGIPIIKEGAIATLSCKVIEAIDLGSHTLFVGEIVEANKVDNIEPMTYAFYRDLKAGKVSFNPEKAETVISTVTEKVQYECSVCHYIYEGEIPFEELPEDYVCPICGKPKSAFHQA